MAQRPENRTKPYKPRPQSRGPRPQSQGLRPHVWRSGPDPLRHEQYTAWLKAKAQANFRKEGWTMTFEQFETMWNQDGSWHQRGRGADDLLMTRRNESQPWSWDNCYIELRREHLRRHASKIRGPRGPNKRTRGRIL